MSKPDPRKTGRSKQDSPHYRLHRWLTRSAAWQSLTPADKAVYLELTELYNGPGSDNGRLVFSIRQGADALHISKDTIARSLQTLQERGFITQMKQGRYARRADHRAAAEWRLNEFPCDVTDSPATKEFMRWAPGKNFLMCLTTRTDRPSGETVASF